MTKSLAPSALEDQPQACVQAVSRRRAVRGPPKAASASERRDETGADDGGAGERALEHGLHGGPAVRWEEVPPVDVGG